METLERTASKVSHATGKFRLAGEANPEEHPYGFRRWLSHPPSTGAKQLTMVDVTIVPGQGHSFHAHPGQEELLFVVAGKLEQWIEREKRILGPGDAAFIPAGMVHASFNGGSDDLRMIVVFSPCVGAEGVEAVDVAAEVPWKGLRA